MSDPESKITTLLPTILHQTRVDKNFARNSYSTFNEYGEDKTLAQSLIVYFYNKLQNAYTDLLGVTHFDPYHFAETMGYSRSYLQTPAKAPYQKEVEGEKSFQELKQCGEALDSKLENVLYRMSQIKMQLKHGGKLKDGMSVHMIDSISILRKVMFVTDPAKPKRKIYGLVFHDEFYANINTFFSRIEIKSFPVLRKSNLYNLYLRLIYLQDIMVSKNITTMETTLKNLLEAAEIEYMEMRRNKLELIKKLEIIYQHTSLNIKVEFKQTKGGKSDYQPVLKIEEFQKIEDIESRFWNEVFNQLHVLYIKLFPEIVNTQTTYVQEFTNWVLDVNKDNSHKRKVYVNSFQKCYNMNLQEFDSRVNGFISELSQKKGALVGKFLT